MRRLSIILLTLLVLSCATGGTQESKTPTSINDLISVDKIITPQTAAYAFASVQYYRFYLLTETKKCATEVQLDEFEAIDKTFRETYVVGREMLDRWLIVNEGQPQTLIKYRELILLAVQLKKVRDSVSCENSQIPRNNFFLKWE